jgi:rRNA-processing protein FCF1
LRENSSKIKIAIVDVTEQEIERPKRGRKIGTQARKKDTQLRACIHKRKYCRIDA